MDTPDGGGLPGQTGAEQGASPDSGPSYADIPSRPHADLSVCEWRTADFHDQECLRFFDCPSHVVARRLDEDDNDGERAAVAHETQEGLVHEQLDETLDEAVYQQATEESPLLAYRTRDGAVAADDISSDSSSSLSTSDGDHNNQGMTDDVPALLELHDDTEGREGYRPASSGTRENPIVLGGSAVQEHRNTLPDQQAESRREEEFVQHLPLLESPRDRGSHSSGLIGQILSPALPATPSVLETVSLATTPNPDHEFPPTQTERVERNGPMEIVLPRWQPDSEVTYCPICHTQFSIFVRKHHCR